MNQPEILDQLNQFFTAFPHHTYPPGHTLIHAGEQPECIYYLCSGRVGQFTITKQGHRLVVNQFQPPAFLPLSLALNPSVSSYDYQVTETTKAHAAPNHQVIKFLRQQPEVTLDVLRRVYRGTDGLLTRMAQLMAGNAYATVITELLITAQRFGQAQLDDSVRISLNQQDLANQVGLARETVSRQLQDLQQQQLITIKREAIIIHNLPALALQLEVNG